MYMYMYMYIYSSQLSMPTLKEGICTWSMHKQTYMYNVICTMYMYMYLAINLTRLTQSYQRRDRS